MDLKLRLLAGIFALFGVTAAADPSSCLPEYNSLQAMQHMDFGAASTAEYQLKSDNASGIFVSKMRMTAAYTPANQQLQLRFHWDDTMTGVSLPYNLFSVLVLQNGSVVGWFDYSRGCTDLGPGLYPGQSFSPPPLKLSGTGKQTLQFMVWGRIN